jgi:oligosaccharyltransferase complex subunit alpha (ribophorin I)
VYHRSQILYRNAHAHLPFAVDSQGNDLHFTYLDTTGRPVLVLEKDNVVSEHNQFFQVTYHFSRVSMLQEPLLLVGAYFLFFVFAMLYVRFELSITPVSAFFFEIFSMGIISHIRYLQEAKVAAENDSKVEELLYKVKDIHDQRVELHNSLKDATEKVGKSKNVAQYNSEKKNIDSTLSKLQTEMLVLINELEELDDVKAAQVRQIDRDEQANCKLYFLLFATWGEGRGLLGDYYFCLFLFPFF